MDITMCKNEKCELKEQCLRYTAIPNKKWQSYTFFDGNEIDNCFWEDINYKRKKLSIH